VVRAELPDGTATEKRLEFEILPKFHETTWFRMLFVVTLAAGAAAAYQLRVRHLRHRFALVLQERTRLAREIHDTLAQGFVGISSQLEAVATALPEDLGSARKYLDLARKMARHCSTEARRSVMDLRASVLEGRNLSAALSSALQIWTVGSGLKVEIDTSGEQRMLPSEFEQHLFRITQEAVTNVVKHAKATTIWVKVHVEHSKLHLHIIDDGQGFHQSKPFSPVDGHFGLIGMRERAERLGGDLRLISHPGEGTRIEVTVPLHEQ
jgi:signal transduction histidine kinase